MDKFLEEKYGLKDTVLEDFKRKIPIKRELHWWTNREQELNKWKKIINESIHCERNIIVFIIGDYGRGKTLSLFKIIDESTKQKEIYPVYLNFKGEEKSKPGIDFIFRIFKSIDFNKILENRSEKEVMEAVMNIPDKYEEPRKILEIIYHGGIDKHQRTLFPGEIRSKGDEINKFALYFLRGEVKPSVSQLKQLGVVRKIDSIDIAKEYLATSLCFLRNLGYKTLLLAIDEFEYLFSLVPKGQHSIYIALLRSLYDFQTSIDKNMLKMANMVFFIAISESGWSSLKGLEEKESKIGGPTVPLLDRVDETTTLGAFSRDETEDLIEKVLRYNRVKEKFEEDPLIPFTKDFVDYIYKKTKGEPRAIKVRCSQVLDAGLADQVPLLTGDYAKKVLMERGF